MLSAALSVASPSQMLLERAAHSSLEKRLGLASLTMLGIGASIGSGIFVITGVAARMAGPATPLCFVLAGLSCLLSGLCYSELASRFPVAGGIYVYLRCSIGELPALIVVANLLLDYQIGAAVLARSFVSYVACAVPGTPSFISSLPISGVFSLSLLAPLVVLVMTALLMRPATNATCANNALTALKLAVIAVVLLAGLRNADAELLRPFAPTGTGAIIGTTALVAFSYTGFDAIANAAEEVPRPHLLVPAATVLCICACAVLYASVSLLLVACVPYRQIDVNAPIAQIFSEQSGSGARWLAPLIAVGAAAGIATTLLVGLFAQARVLLGVARDAPIRALRPLARVSAGAKTPWAAQAYCGGVAAFLSLLLEVHQLAPLLSAGILLSYAAAAVAVLALRMQTAPVDAERPSTSRRSFLAIAVFCPAVALAVRLTAVAAYGFAWYGSIVLCVLSAVPFALLQRFGPLPSSGFATPLVPALPTVTLICQLILLSHLPWQAGVRLAVVGALVALAFAMSHERATAAPLAEEEPVERSAGAALHSTLLLPGMEADSGEDSGGRDDAPLEPLVLGSAETRGAVGRPQAQPVSDSDGRSAASAEQAEEQGAASAAAAGQGANIEAAGVDESPH